MTDYIVKSYEEELGAELLIVSVPDNVNKDEVFENFEMAARYASSHFDYDKEANEWYTDEDREEYDEHFDEMADYREESNGEDTFCYYLKKHCGYKVEYLRHDFEFEW